MRGEILWASIAMIVMGWLSPPVVAQQGVEPPRDIALLVDVSGSVRTQGWQDGDKEIVWRLITGLKSSQLRSWNQLDEDMASYFRDSLVEGSTPLAQPGSSLLLIRFGDLDTTRNLGDRRWDDVPMVIGSDVQREVRTYFTRNYPVRSTDYKDSLTHLDLAKAIAYDRIKTKNERGYYLIIVSDEKPDPVNPQPLWNEDERLMYDAWHRAQGSDIIEIAKFRRRNSALMITLRAVGFDPDPNRIKPREVVQPVDTQLSNLAIEFLGTLKGATDTDSSYLPLTEPPHFAWQVKHDSEVNRRFEVTLRGLDERQEFHPPAVSTKKAYYVHNKNSKLLPGTYGLTVSSPGVEASPEVFFRIKSSRDYLLWIAFLAGVLSIAVFLYTWWTLRRGQA